jgi:hypothetical protein
MFILLLLLKERGCKISGCNFLPVAALECHHTGVAAGGGCHDVEDF